MLSLAGNDADTIKEHKTALPARLASERSPLCALCVSTWSSKQNDFWGHCSLDIHQQHFDIYVIGLCKSLKSKTRIHVRTWIHMTSYLAGRVNRSWIQVVSRWRQFLRLWQARPPNFLLNSSVKKLNFCVKIFSYFTSKSYFLCERIAARTSKKKMWCE